MQNKYDVIDIVGEGAYGIVMKCKNKETNEVVAIKKFKDSEDEIVQKSMVRELKVLKKLKHDNIVQLKECFKRKSKLYLVFEYVEKNLLEMIDINTGGLDQQIVKKIIYQLCKAVVYIHSNDMLHRDIKPENILVTNDFTVKVCDFGFARTVPQKGGVLTDYVATRWYRSPELLLGCSNYGKEVDYWAIGCIMGEITDGQPMFPGENEHQQLGYIQKLLGTLPPSQMEVFYSNPRYGGNKLEPVPKPETLERRYYGKLSKTAMSFMKSLLKLDPRERISGLDIIMHTFFDDIRADDPEFASLKPQKIICASSNATTEQKQKSRTNEPVLQHPRNNKFSNQNVTKTNFNTTIGSIAGNINYSKSPPKDVISNGLNKAAGQQIKMPKNFKMNYEGSNINNQNINTNNTNNVAIAQTSSHLNTNMSGFGMNKTSTKTFYNIKDKDDIYNFNIGVKFDNNSTIAQAPSNANIEIKKKKGNNLIVIEEEGSAAVPINDINTIDFERKVNMNSTFKNSGNNFVMKAGNAIQHEPRYNKFKPDTGSEYEEEIPHHQAKNYSSPKNLHNNKKDTINNKFGKIIIKEESPDMKMSSMMNTNSNFNFLPQISSYRNFDEGMRKTKNIIMK
jgi:serine/threonine protein kinase